MTLQGLRCAVISLLFALSYPSAFSESFQKELDQQLDGLSIAIDDIEKDISDLKKDILFPPVTRLTVYVSVAPDVLFDLHSLTLLVDGKEKSFHIYSERDIAALRLGGMQKLYEGNVTLGFHDVKAVFKGKTKKEKPASHAVDLTFEKKLEGHVLNLAVKASSDSKAPQFLALDLGAE